jgi:hypothetical protein
MQLISFPYHDRGIQKQLRTYLGAYIISIENKMLDSELGMKWLPRYISHSFMVKTSESLCIVLYIAIVKSNCFRLELSSFFHFLFIYLFSLFRCLICRLRKIIGPSMLTWMVNGMSNLICEQRKSMIYSLRGEMRDCRMPVDLFLCFRFWPDWIINCNLLICLGPSIRFFTNFHPSRILTFHADFRWSLFV